MKQHLARAWWFAASFVCFCGTVAWAMFLIHPSLKGWFPTQLIPLVSGILCLIGLPYCTARAAPEQIAQSGKPPN
jgi:hypothetical protein